MGYPAPKLKNFNASTESYINFLEPLLKDPLQNRLSSEEKKKQDQLWTMITLLKSEFCKHKLNNIFSAAIQNIPTSEEDASQIFNCLPKNQDIGLGQNIDLGRIYAQQYTEQFWKWIGSEIVFLPPDSTLLFLKICLNSRDFTPLDTNVWEELLALPGWSDVQKKEIKNFKLKHEFINKNSNCLAYIKEQESGLARKAPFCVKNQKELQKQYMSQYRLLLKFTENFFEKVFDTRRQDLDQQSKMMNAVNTSGDAFFQGISSLIQKMSCFMEKENFSFELGSWEDRFLNNFKNISYKIFAWRVKKMLPKLLTSLKEVVDKLQKTNQELLPVQTMQRGFLGVLGKGSPQYSSLEANIKQFDLRNTQFNEWEKGLSSFELLSRSLLDCFVKQQKEEPTESQKALIEKNQRELIEEEEKANFPQGKSFPFPVSLDSDSEEEDFLQDLLDIQPTSTAVLNVPVFSFSEMDAFLKNPNQVNGCLSKGANGILKQLKTHLLKRQVDLPNELKTLKNTKIHEIHAQLVLATAAQEQIIQAIQDQRWNHIVLGFRNIFIHCHFAIEQMLSLKVLTENKEVANTHDLSELAKKAHIDRLDEQINFLKGIGMHLWFCYPGDYRAFYPNDCPKPFIFLEKLFHPYRGKNLDTKLLTEAVQLCFGMYGQTIEFISKVSSSSDQNLDEFLKRTKEIQQKTQAKINKSKHSNKGLAESPLLQKLKETLDLFEKIKIPPDLEEKDLLQRPLNTIKEYLQLMKFSLESPPESHTHSLQKFFHIEVLANMDKLFKHLFRTIILLQTGEDNHSHHLLTLFRLAENFYVKELLTDQDKETFEKINLSITHHYLHKKSSVSLQKEYKKFFGQADKLATCSEEDSTRFGKKDISYQDLEKQKDLIYAELEPALNLFHKLLHPLISEFEELNAFELKGV